MITGKQRQVLTIFANGGSDKTAARQLGVSQGAVSDRLQRSCIRLGARNRTHAVAIAVREKLVVPT